MRARKRDLVGRTIVAVDFNRTWEPLRHTWQTYPTLTLDNGRKIWIVTEENEGSEYGHAICITERAKKRSNVGPTGERNAIRRNN